MSESLLRIGGNSEQDSLPPAFQAVGEALVRALRQRVRDTHVAERERLAFWFDQPSRTIDYDRYADAFAVSYLLPNYWKAAHALHSAAPQSRPNIVDLGAGSGAAAWAALAWLADRADAPEHLEIHLLDRSERALALARELSHEVLASLPELQARVRIELTDLRNGASMPADSLILLSHVLTEQGTELEPLLSSVLPECSYRNVLIVERRDDDVWGHIDHATKRLGCDRESRHVKVHWAVESLIPTPERAPALRTRWMLLSRPEPAAARVAARYFEAWRTRDLDGIQDVFTAGATYMYDPFQPPLRGHAEIAQYWREQVMTQRNLTITPHMLAVTDNEAILEWTAGFERDLLKVRLCGMMIVRIDPEQERIVELREYYRSHKLSANSAGADP